MVFPVRAHHIWSIEYQGGSVMIRVFFETVVAGLLFTVLMIHSPEAAAQPFMPTPGHTYGEVGLYVTGIRPEGEFGEVLDQSAFGIGLQDFLSPFILPVSIGLELDYGFYDSEPFEESLLDGAPEWKVEVHRENKLFRGALLAKLQPTWGRLSPHLDVALGFQRLWTTSEVRIPIPRKSLPMNC